MKISIYKVLKITTLFCLAGLFHSCSGEETKTATAISNEASAPHIVFVTGDEEYRSEESMPMLAQLAKKHMGAKVTVLYSLDSAGYVDPNNTHHIAGLEALEDADLMVAFMRFRELPMEEAKYITDYAESGKPMMGFRTSTHAFKYLTDSTMMHLNDDWPTRVFGQQWITHHGHFEDGHNPLTAVSILENENPILNGVEPFEAFSWLYHVDGGEWKLHGDDVQPLLQGRTLRSKHEMAGRLDQYPPTQPVAWTKTYTGSSGKSARVFFTTLGHPYDFTLEPMRKLALNGLFWALGKEDMIPADGFDVTPVSAYEPNNSGFGEKFKKEMRPQVIN